MCILFKEKSSSKDILFIIDFRERGREEERDKRQIDINVREKHPSAPVRTEYTSQGIFFKHILLFIHFLTLSRGYDY